MHRFKEEREKEREKKEKEKKKEKKKKKRKEKKKRKKRTKERRNKQTNKKEEERFAARSFMLTPERECDVIFIPGTTHATCIEEMTDTLHSSVHRRQYHCRYHHLFVYLSSASALGGQRVFVEKRPLQTFTRLFLPPARHPCYVFC